MTATEVPNMSLSSRVPLNPPARSLIFCDAFTLPFVLRKVSGGMGQRIMIAMMLIPDPEILIADEPTSALDVSVQLQVLEIMDKLVTDRGMGLIFITLNIPDAGAAEAWRPA